MHRSRLAGFIIDCQTGDLEQAAQFWGEALGYSIHRPDDPVEGNYVHLQTGPDEMHIEVQSVEHPSRVHLDIEADDIEAEVTRLEKLGAKRIGKVKTWVVMEAPTGQRFCVIKPQRENFASQANEWR